MEKQELKGKVIYAYGIDKHRAGCYGYMANIEDVKNGLVYCYAKDNLPESLQESTRAETMDEAIMHIRRFGTKHSEVIVTNDYANSRKFQQMVDAACVYVNASSRFSDGFQFGFGAEIGISTQKLHARGPMGLKELTSYKYIINGSGQVRK